MLDIIKEEEKNTNQNKYKAELDILSNQLIEKTTTLLFKNNKLIENEDFHNFKRKHMQKWGNIAFLIRRLEKLLVNLRKDYEHLDNKGNNEFGNDIIYVDGSELVKLAKNELRQPKDNELLSCIKGKDEKYIYHQAAIKIQARVRAYLVSKVYKKTKQLIYYSNKIKNKWRLTKLYRSTMRRCNDI